MSKILFANAHSLFDYTDGASNSIRLILERLSLLGHEVFVVTGLISNGLDGCNYSKEFFKNDLNDEIKKIFLMKNSDFAITDSQSTLNLYKNEYSKPIFVLPKFLAKSPKNNQKTIIEKNKYKCLFVNPIIKKGLEPFILICHFANKNQMPLDFTCIDSNNNIVNELSLLNYDANQLPPNVKIKSSQINNYELFKDIDILLLPSLWHESGSRLIYEAYAYGIPVIAFNTGGTAELIGKFKKNLFDSPKVYFDNNYILRLHNWEPNVICKRIFEIINDYKNESEEIKRYYKNLDLDMNCNKKLNEIINFVDNNNS